MIIFPRALKPNSQASSPYLRGVRIRRGGGLIDDERAEGGAGGEWVLRGRVLKALRQHLPVSVMRKNRNNSSEGKRRRASRPLVKKQLLHKAPAARRRAWGQPGVGSPRARHHKSFTVTSPECKTSSVSIIVHSCSLIYLGMYVHHHKACRTPSETHEHGHWRGVSVGTAAFTTRGRGTSGAGTERVLLRPA